MPERDPLRRNAFFPRSQRVRARGRRCARKSIEFERLEELVLLSTTFTVTNLNDAGPGSLRQAMLDANAVGGHDVIAFAVDSGPQTLAPLGPLPVITDPVTIDATTQPGYSGSPLIAIDGISAGATTGLVVISGSSTIRGLAVKRFEVGGIGLFFVGENVVEGNYIGFELDGVTPAGNRGQGITILGDGRNRVGTDGDGVNDAAERNVIGNNVGNGVFIQGGSSGNVIAGNHIGTDASGTRARPNSFDGIFITEGSHSNRVGTDGDGVNDAAERNVISGHSGANIRLGGGATANTIAGNYIGTDSSGTFALTNGNFGILVNQASGNLIGGSSPSAGNLISGHVNGLAITFASDNRVAGNRIGTDATGTASIPNTTFGLWLAAAATNNRVGTDADGVNDPAERNVISGNGNTNLFINAGANGNAIAGNYIGPDVSGTRGFAIGNNGILIDQSPGNLIGGDVAAARNVISGNRIQGIDIRGAGSTGNVIVGNFVGTDATGTAPLGNGGNGFVLRDAPSNRIGGPGVGERNVISANGSGILLLGGGSNENSVQGNLIGTDFTGTQPLGNVADGVLIQGGSRNRIGGGAAGEGNLLSANGNRGVYVLQYDATGAVATDNQISGNRIGTDASGMLPLPNLDGVVISRGATGTVVGTNSDGLNDAFEGNLIGSNLRNGILIQGGSFENVIAGNFIGTDASGTLRRANGVDGVVITEESHSNRVGTDGDGINDVAERNLISGNGSVNIRITGGANENIVAGNYIGTNALGTFALVNGNFGVLIDHGSGNRIGGSTPTSGNLISGHMNGVAVTFASDNTIAGNFIGTDASGSFSIPNSIFGVWLSTAASNNRVGTDADGVSDAAERNVISGNGNTNLFISGGATANTIAGNFIGPDVSGSLALATAGNGILIEQSPGNVIGGVVPAARNVVSGNRIQGIDLRGAGSTGNVIVGNFVGTDATGTAPLGNSGNGLVLRDAPGNQIGGPGAGEGNLISANGSGVLFLGGGSSSNVVQGNLIGTDLTGTQPLGNVAQGVLIQGGSRNRIGGGGAGEGNLISANGSRGVYVIQYDATGAVATDNQISGNRIGTDASGTTALPNLYGVFLSRGATGTFVGTNSDGLNDASEGNLIAGNTSFGVIVSQPGSSLNVVAGNTIGLGAGGIPLGNQGGGVFVSLGAQRTRVGTNGDGVSDGIEANVIAHNGSAGVVVFDADTVGTSIRGNVIHHNAGYAIALGPDGLTPNDPLDADLGPNQLQNTPQIDTAVTGPTTRVIGSLRSEPGTTYTIDAYSTPLADLGQAARWLGSFTLTTDASGYASLDVTLASATSSTETVTATATDPDGNTSELSSPAPHADAGGPYAVAEGSGVVLDASATTDLDQPPATLLYEWDLDGDGLYGESGPGAERGDEMGISPVFSAAGLNGPSSRMVSLRVVDAVGYTSFASAMILIENAPPQVDVGEGAFLVEGGAFVRAGGFMDPGGDAVSATVDYGDGSGPLPLPLNPDGTFLLGHPYQEDGEFVLTVTLTDSEGASTSGTIDVSVANAGPDVGAIALTSPAFAGRALQFAASFTDPGRLDTHSAEWDWGDGSSTNGLVSESSGAGSAIGTHAYARSGVYLVRLTVTDDDGDPGVSTFLVTISPSILLLHPTASGTLTLSGNASLATSVDVVVNSTSTSAVVASGNASVDTASLGIAGSYHLGGNATIAGGITTGIDPVADPLVHLGTPSAGPAQNAVDVGGNTVVTIAPGVYPRIVASGNARIVMSPGIYVVKGGGFTVSGNARVEGQGVLIYNAGSSFPAAGGATGPVAFSGNSVVTLSAPTSGPYEGAVLYQARDNTRPLSLSGNARADLDGLIYGPAAALRVSGNARLSALLIASNLNLTGNAAFEVLTGGSQPEFNHGQEIGLETRSQERSGELLPLVAGPALAGVFLGVSPDQLDGSDVPSAQTRETPRRGSRVPADVLVGLVFPRGRRFRPAESVARPLLSRS